MLNPKVLRVTATAFAALVISACATISSDDNTQPLLYPELYRQALTSYPGSASVSDQTVQRFVDFLADLGSPTSGKVADEVYARDLHFSDALMVTNDKQAVVNHFASLSDAGTEVDVEIHQILRQGADVYLIWSMQARFKPLRREVSSDTLGATHVRFDSAGKVVLHQDFWDSGLGFYSHIPVLGAGVRAVGRRFAAEP
ncbi:MAG: nuclear transport factor 2 family protein [Gammaproteobacteria bacterium TMED92]|nr:MAG: nuclear transport factor 2 family protein [Gammaproteobacteria bacterium TMED92]